MTINKKNIAAITLASSLLTVSNVQAVEPDPCGAELCLSGVALVAGGAKDCKVHIKKFFSIKGFEKGVYHPAISYVKRYKWLNQCKSGNKAFKVAIMDTYGLLPTIPF